MKDWKSFERSVADAKLLGGVRIPVSGRSRRGNPDIDHIDHSELAVEVKIRRRLPEWICKAMKQAENSATGGRLPVVVLHQDPSRYAESLILMRLKDFVPTTSLEESRGQGERTGGDSEKPTVEIYTDGGCMVNPGKGGWAALLYDDGPKPRELSGVEPGTTNNRMELRAAIEGLKALEVPSRVRLYSDSAYLVEAFNKGWLSNWKRNGWRTARKKAVENSDLWRDLLALTKRHDVKFVKIKGHAGIGANERCHDLVQLAISR